MDERLERYAELVVRVGANVQPGQEVFLQSAVEHTSSRAPSSARPTGPARPMSTSSTATATCGGR